MKRILIFICASIAFLMSSLSFAEGSFFSVNATGTPGIATVTLCLDGRGPTSCQSALVGSLTLNISTIFPGHTYPNAGILVSTPGVYLANPGIDCRVLSNGYCVFSVSNNSPKTITLASNNYSPPVTTATLTSTAAVTLSVTGLTTTTGANSGTARQITITNIGPNIAKNINYKINPPLPRGTTISPANCGNLSAGSTCVLTITPGATPTNTVGNSSPTPSVLSVTGDNTNATTSNINVLTYGSFYEAGWLYSIIESASTSPSIGGSVAAVTDSVAPSTGIEYSPAGAITVGATSGAADRTNTKTMATSYGTAANYSAGNCIPPNYASGGFTDWYLPSICQFGFGATDTNFNCTSSSSANYIPNIMANLLIANPAQNFNFVNGGFYWSSTASVTGAPNNAWLQQIAFGGTPGTQTASPVTSLGGVRCVRDIT